MRWAQHAVLLRKMGKSILLKPSQMVFILLTGNPRERPSLGVQREGKSAGALV